MKNPKKRKRSPSATSGMTLRPRNKMRKLNGGSEDGGDEDVTYNPDAANAAGASYIRYEIIDKKGK